MPTSTVRRQLYWRLAIGLIAVTGAYIWYVTVQYGRINDLNQRQLANASAELKNSIENAIGTVRRFKPSPTDDQALCEFDDDQPYLALISPAKCKRVTGGLASPKLAVATGLSIKAIAEVRSTDKNNPSPAPPADDAVSFAFDAGAVLRELSFPESFGLIFIGDSEGTVLYQDAPYKRTWLRQLRWGEQQFRDSGANRSGSLKLDQLVNVFGDDTASGWTPLRSMSGRTTLRLGGQFHEVYLEPLVIENQDERVSLVLGGAVLTEAVVRQALAVDSYFLAGIVFLLLLTFLGYPFVKLLALDPHERFGLRDVMKLYLSTAALLALATFTIQAIDAYSRWHHVADDGMKQLAIRFELAFLNEIAEIQRQEDKYDQTVSQWSDAQLSEPLTTDWFGSGPEGRKTPWLPAPKGPVQVLQLAWIDPAGDQVWKITSDRTTSRQKVGQRIYFQSVRDGNLFTWPDQVSCDEDEAPCADLPTASIISRPFYVSPERSITDGKFYTFVAMPSRVSVKGKPGTYVVNATARLFSLNTPALPAGYGFALINREGRVLYHSDRRLSLRENLFEELTAGKRARALVYAGYEDDVTSAYRERPHELHFRPVSLRLASDRRAAAGLYLVTFRDISLERALVARVFLISMFGPMISLLLFIGLALIAVAMVPAGRRDRREHWSAWLWPHGGIVLVYQEMSIVLAILLAVSLIAWAVGAPDGLFVAVPVLAMTATIVIYAIRTHQKPQRSQLPSQFWHSSAYMLLMVCAILIPASALFRAAMGHEFGKLIATEQQWITAQKTDLPFAQQAELRAEKLPIDMTLSTGKTRASLLSEIPAPAPFGSANQDTTLGHATHWLLKPFEWADDFLPIESDLAARVRYEEADLTYTPQTLWTSKLGISVWGILGLIGALGLLVWWVRWKQVRLFYADQEICPQEHASPATLWEQCSADERMVLMRISDEHVENPYQRPIVVGLLQRGLLTLDPDLRPCSQAFAEFIATQQPALRDALHQWESVESGHSWRYTRLVLLTSMGGLLFFLIATQPGLQAGLVSVAGGVTIALESLLKVRDSVVAWLGTRTPRRS